MDQGRKRGKRWVQVLLIVTGTLFLGCLTCAGAGWLFLEIAAADMCENEVEKEVTSPNGRLKAVIFRRNCGATTGISTQVSIVRANGSVTGLPDRGGNVAVYRDVSVSVAWNADDELVVRGAGERFKAEERVNGVLIQYE